MEAIDVCGAVKNYGTNYVLDGLNMKVPSGAIYGLLGASGCGKTTLLRCILGQLKLTKGNITVLGKPPGSFGHEVPGKDVGYMPQDIALYGEFNMSETLYYFGILHRMSLKAVRERRLFLQELLELPKMNKLIRTLSGGQQRRFSFAVAMLQEPPLLILDEPTVGVDPILRARIWEHLKNMESTTVIITTHYIEEARHAHLVGMMRDGKLLAESPPSSLIQKYGLSNLEEVFLLLCRRVTDTEIQHVLRQSDEEVHINYTEFESCLTDQRETHFHEKKETRGICGKIKQQVSVTATSFVDWCKCGSNPVAFVPRPMNVVAACWKNIIKVYRNPGLLLFKLIIPALIIALFCWTIGRNLTGIKVAYTNDDNSSFPLSLICTNDGGLVNLSNLGDLYLSRLMNDATLSMTEYARIEDSIAQVELGNAWAAIYLGPNFTVDLISRICSTYPSNCSNVPISDPLTDTTINGSRVHIYADITNLQVSDTIFDQTSAAYDLFLSRLIQSCSNLLDVNASTILSPSIVVEQPLIYGTNDLTFTDYIAPGMIINVIFGITIGSAAISVLLERKDGLIARTWVAGSNASEIIIAHIFIEFFIFLVQTILILVVVIDGFKVYIATLSNVWAIGAMILLQGLTGMSFGLLLSAISSTEYAATQVAVAAFYPTFLLSGSLWPLQGVPRWLRYIGYSLPCTLPSQSMRAMMGRGWGLEYTEVWGGFLVTIGWLTLLLLLTGIAFK